MVRVRDGNYSRPIIFEKNSLGPNIPSEDLYLSPLHAVNIGTQMVQAHYLVNGSTIRYDTKTVVAHYYNIYTKDHSVIVSNNLLTETMSYDPREVEKKSAQPIKTDCIAV